MWKSERNVNDCFVFYVFMHQYFIYLNMYILHTFIIKQEIRSWRYEIYDIKDLKKKSALEHIEPKPLPS